LDIAIGSSYELETQVLLSQDFGYILPENGKELIGVITTVQKMLNGLKNKMTVVS
jgi:four helix bundle protein